MGMHAKKIQILFSLIEVCDVHASRLSMACQHLSPLLPLKPEDIDTFTDEQLGFMELLISRFGKLQDTIRSRIFPLLLDLLMWQNADVKSFLDILHQMEKRELLPSAKEWIEMRELRNHLTHEYPDNPSLMANNINEAVKSSQNLVHYWYFLKEKAKETAGKWTEELT